MSPASHRHRLEGLEPDNLLAFLAMLGLLRAISATETQENQPGQPRISWSIDQLPLRPQLQLKQTTTTAEICEIADQGLELLAKNEQLKFEANKDLDFEQTQAREILHALALNASLQNRSRADVLCALMNDAAVKEKKGKDCIIPTPFCLLFGQGHQHFLKRFCRLPLEADPPARGRGKKALTVTAAQSLHEALFEPWQRQDASDSLRWDPEEAARYALMPGDPSDIAYKLRTQHGANRLAVFGLPALTTAPENRAGTIRLSVLGGRWDHEGFSFAWPIWRGSATLAAIRAMLSHPDLRQPDALRHLGVEQIRVTRRISTGKFMNFTRAEYQIC